MIHSGLRRGVAEQFSFLRVGVISVKVTNNRRRSTFRGLVALTALLLVTSSCGSERSVEAFCATYHEETEQLTEKYNQRFELAEGQGAIVGLGVAFGSLVEAQGDVVVLFDRLEKNAPEEIAPDVAAVQDALEKQAEATASGELVQMLFGSAMAAFQANGPAGRVDDYLLQNCGLNQ